MHAAAAAAGIMLALAGWLCPFPDFFMPGVSGLVSVVAPLLHAMCSGPQYAFHSSDLELIYAPCYSSLCFLLLIST